MYKKVLENLKKVEVIGLDLFKSSDNHPVHNKKPHFIFSAENPLYPSKLNMTHEQVVDHLNKKGYKTEEVDGKYGDEERSILVHNPPKHAIKNLKKLASKLGQESSIYSDGQKHEMHYHHGENAGKYNKGYGTNFYSEKPDDFYTTLSDGTHFAHNLDLDNFYENPKKEKEDSGLLKSEEKEDKLPYIPQAEKHPLENLGEQTKLIHYSPTKGVKEIDPNYHRIRGIGAEAKQGAPEHKTSFYYLENIDPEPVVLTGSKSKYVTSLGNKKLYDIYKDPDRIGEKSLSKLKEEANNRNTNKGIVYPHEKRPAYHKAIREAGYNGFYNSGYGADHTMGNVVAMFDKMSPEEEYDIHPKDFRNTSTTDHHGEDRKIKEAKKFAQENGHHDHKFLNNLSNSIKEEK